MAGSKAQARKSNIGKAEFAERNHRQENGKSVQKRQVSIHLREDIHRDAKIALLLRGGKQDFSALVGTIAEGIPGQTRHSYWKGSVINAKHPLFCNWANSKNSYPRCSVAHSQSRLHH